VIALAGLGWNFFAYSLKFGNAVWGMLLPRARPLGVDFRDGLYDPARAFTTVHSGWPPLTLLLGRRSPGELLDGLRHPGLHPGRPRPGRGGPERPLAVKAACADDLPGAKVDTPSSGSSWASGS